MKHLKQLVVPILLIIGVICMGIFMNYGTLIPCKMLKKEMKPIIREHLHEQISQMRSEPRADLDHSLEVELVNPLTNDFVDNFKQYECIGCLIKIHLSGKEAMKNNFKNSLEKK